MGQSTFSGPVAAGNVKYTTGTTPGTMANVGYVVLTQVLSIPAASLTAGTSGSAQIAMLPAFSQITNINIDTTTAFTFTGGTTPAMNATVGYSSSNNSYVPSTAITALGRITNTGTFANWVNVNTSPATTTDVPIFLNWAASGTPTAVTAGAVTVTVLYVQYDNVNTYT
jgi:hypothetical protein